MRGGAFLYYRMPFIEGESVRDRLNREQRFSIENTLEITKVIASALDRLPRLARCLRDY